MAIEKLNWEDTLALVERLPESDRLKLVHEVLYRLHRPAPASENAVDLLTLAGAGADVWAGIDVETYIKEERDSWQ